MEERWSGRRRRHLGEAQSRSELCGVSRGGEEAGLAGWRAKGPWPALVQGGVWEAQEFGEQGGAGSRGMLSSCWLTRKSPGCSVQQELDGKLPPVGRLDRCSGEQC